MDFKWSSASKQRGFDEDLDPVREKPRLWEPQMNDGVLVGYLLWGWVKHLQFWGWPAIDAMHGKKFRWTLFVGDETYHHVVNPPILEANPSHFWICRRLARGEMPGVGAQHRPASPSIVLPGHLPRNLRFSIGNLRVKPRCCWPCEMTETFLLKPPHLVLGKPNLGEAEQRFLWRIATHQGVHIALGLYELGWSDDHWKIGVFWRNRRPRGLGLFFSGRSHVFDCSDSCYTGVFRCRWCAVWGRWGDADLLELCWHFSLAKDGEHIVSKKNAG